jgi:hypothetical protein
LNFLLPSLQAASPLKRGKIFQHTLFPVVRLSHTLALPHKNFQEQKITYQMMVFYSLIMSRFVEVLGIVLELLLLLNFITGNKASLGIFSWFK